MSELNTTNAVSAYLGDKKEQAVNATKSSMYLSVDTNPDYEAELRKVSAKTGIPVDSAAAFPEEAKRAARMADINFNDMAARFPSTTKFLSNVGNAKVSHDDVENLSGIEKGLDYLKKGGSAFASSLPQANAGLWGVAQSGADLLSDFIGKPLAGNVLPEDPFARLSGGIADLRKMQQGLADRMMPAGSGPIESGVYSGLQSTGQTLLTIPAAILTGQPELTLGAMAATTGGQSYAKAKDAGKSTTESLLYGTSDAIVEAGTEGFSLGPLLSGLKAGAPFLKVMLGNQLREQFGEQSATLLQDLNEWAVMNPEKSFGDYLKARPDAAIQTAVATVVGSGAQVTILKAAQVAATKAGLMQTRAQQADSTAAQLTDLNHMAETSKLRPRDPEAFKAFINQAMEDGPVNDLYLSAESLSQSGVNVEELAKLSPSFAEQVGLAAEIGGDIRIPIDEFMTTIGGTELAQSLIPHLRTDPNALSQAQAQEQMKSAGESMQREVERVLSEHADDNAFNASRDAVAANFQQQFDAAARFTPDVNKAYAGMAASFYSVAAAKVGVMPEQLAAQYPLRVQAESLVGDQTLSQALPDQVESIIQADTGQSPAAITEGNAATAAAESIGTASSQELNQTKRGSITLSGDMRNQPTVITLLENADLSTALHEFGHFFLEVYNDLATQENAPAEIKNDLNAVFKWFGKDMDSAKWNAMNLEEKRDYHEQFARGFESYLFEGKSPNIEMRGVFSRFRSWLMNVYRSASNLNVQLSDEVRGVFDRMLASTETIKEAEAIGNLMPAFATAEEAGMTTEQFKAYHDLGMQATQDAISALETRSLRDLQWLDNAKSKVLKQLQKDAAEKRKAMRKEVEPGVMAEPVNQVRNYLKRGEVDGVKVGEPVRLSIPEMKEMYSEDGAPDWQSLGYGKYGMLAEEGVHPDMIAAQFGYSSGDQMVQELLAQPKPRDKIEAVTDQRMLEKYGDITSQQALEQAAAAAIHNDFRTKVLTTEANIFAKAAGMPSIIAKAAKQFAADLISRQRVRDLKPSQYTNAEARAAKASAIARTKGDIAEAAIQKRNQLIQNFAAKEAISAQEEIESIVRYLKKFDRSGTRKNLRGEYLVQLDALLERFDLRASTTLKSIDEAKRMAIGEWAAKEAERLASPVPELPEFVLNDAYQKSFKELTVAEMRGLKDSVKQLEHMARREHTAFITQRNMTIQQEVNTGVAEMMEIYPEAFEDGEPIKPDPLTHQYAPKFSRALEDVSGRLKAEFIPMETLVDLLTAGKFGQLHDSLFGRLSNASDKKAELAGQIRERLKPFYDAYSFKEKRDFARKEIPGTRMTKENLLMMALYYGNAEGRQRLASQGFTDQIVLPMLSKLSTKDLNLAEAIWDLNDQFLWPQYKALNERTRGVAPAQVKPAEMVINGRHLNGGYIKLVYDSKFDETTRGRDSKEDAMSLMMGAGSYSAKTSQGSSNERISELNKMPLLELRAVGQAVNEHMHDIAYREAVADTVRILKEPRMQDSIKAVSGEHVYAELMDKLKEVAARPIEPSGMVLGLLNTARKNTVVVLMSGIKTALVNYSGLIPALTRVNAGSLVKATAKVHSNRAFQMVRFAQEKSSYMRERQNSFTSDLQQTMDALTVKNQIMPSMGSFLIMMRMIDTMTSTTVWLAAYEDGNKRFKSEDGTPDDARAIEYANSVTRTTQGSGRDVDTSKIQTRYGAWSKPFFMFYSYFNSQLALLIRQGVIAERKWSAGDRAAAVGLFTASYIAIVVIPALINDLASGKCDEAIAGNEGWTRCIAKSITMNMAGFIPVVRDFVPYGWSLFDKKTPNYGLKMTSLVAYFEGIAKGIASGEKAIEGDASEKDTKNIFMGLAFAMGLPGKLMWDVGAGTEAVANDNAPVESIIFGPPKK